ncbi:DUF92 domain-containing protein [Mucilaginibacter hurinus]|uniref:DUF92 domain-containing protein n=1 Tax=Mucilaginibacter hurinus TaxID=2201324 RepID=A0A367GT05_9SPHI|nr:DUF92 domain-containing protein [Mucilaginibacter hurinus]RCH56380.1 DUF92 domain-containing protein [Mucilaginibacter hurinus]
MPFKYVVLCLIVLSGMVFAIRTHKLTPWAAFVGGIVGLAVFIGAGFTGVSMLTAFFMMGSAATMWQKSLKEDMKLVERADATRRTSQVLANAGVAALMGVLAYALPAHASVFQLMMAGALASATSDTLSSELGMVYGSGAYNILTFKRDKKGMDGVVSVEGTLIGAWGGAIIATIYVIGFGNNYALVTIIVAATVGNLADSVLGATLERKGIIGNNIVNFLSTGAASLIVLLLN